MIRPLRAWHRRAVFALAPLLPAIFAAGLASRHAAAPSNPALAAEMDCLSWRAPVVVRLGEAEAPVRRSADRRWVRIELPWDAAQPDLLVYWSAAGSSDAALPMDARLLGTAGAAVPLRERRGTLILYSLAHQRVSGSIRVEAIP